jgi:hypothetical protein
MKGKPWKLLSSFLLVSLSFSFLGLALSTFRFNEANQEEEAMRRAQENAVLFSKNYAYTTPNGGDYSSTLAFSEEEKKALEKKYSMTLEGFTPSSGAIRLYENYDEVESNGKITLSYYPISTSGLYPVESLPKSFSLLSGKLPEKEGEVLITKRHFEAFQALGYSYWDSNGKKISTPKESITLSSILGKALYGTSSQPVYTISGVVDTSFPSSFFTSLKECDEAKKEAPFSLDNVKQYLEKLDDTSFHNLLFVKRSVLPSPKESHFLTYRHLPAEALLYEKNGTAKHYLARAYEKPATLPLSFGAASLKKGECYLDAKSYALFLKDGANLFSQTLYNRYVSTYEEGNRLYGSESDPLPEGEAPRNLKGLLSSFWYLGCLTFAKDHLQEAVASGFPFRDYDPSFPSSPTSDDEERSFHGYLYSTCRKTPSLDPLTKDYSTRLFAFSESLMNEALKDVDFDLSRGLSLTFNVSNNQGSVEEAMAVLGFYFPSGEYDDGNALDGPLFLGMEDSQDYLSEVHAVYARLLGAIPTKKDDRMRLWKDTQEAWSKSGVSTRLDNRPIGDAHNMGLALSAYSILFSSIGGVLLFFAVILFASTIASSISYKKREIGILRALGAHAKDVYWIFSLEAMLLAFFSALNASFLTFLSSSLINRYFAGVKQGLSFVDFLSPDIVVVLLLLLISVLTAFLASFIPSFKVAKKEPVEAIRSLS